MTPNLLNTVLGVALVYCAVLAPGSLHAVVVLAGGAGIIALALWARGGDSLKWFNLLNVALGAALMLLGAARGITAVHPLVMFWWVFWVGIIVAVIAFWSALYNCQSAMTPSKSP
jgi:hypothetical protein